MRPRNSRVRELAAKLRPNLKEIEDRRKLASACGIRHLQQLNRSFPQKGSPAPQVRLTGPIALLACRWLEELPDRQPKLYIPTWDVLRLIGLQLTRSRAMFDALKNRVGGGISRDQIYSYFHQQRRIPDGEFVLRMIDFLSLLRGVQEDENLAMKLEMEPQWRCVQAALEIEEDAAEERSAELKQTLRCRIKRPRFQPQSTSFSILRRLRKSVKSV